MQSGDFIPGKKVNFIYHSMQGEILTKDPDLKINDCDYTDSLQEEKDSCNHYDDDNEMKIGGAQSFGTKKEQQDRYTAGTFSSLFNQLNPRFRKMFLQDIPRLLQQALISSPDLKEGCIQVNGSTFTMAVLQGKNIYTANVGDSTVHAILINKTTGKVTSHSQLTTDHNLKTLFKTIPVPPLSDPNDPALDYEIKVPNPNHPRKLHPIKVNNLGNGIRLAGYGVNMHRAMADCNGEAAGLSHEADVLAHSIPVPENHELLLFAACDGITDWLDNSSTFTHTVEEFWKKNKSYGQLAAHMTETAVRVGQTVEKIDGQPKNIDNMSVVILGGNDNKSMDDEKQPARYIAMMDGHGHHHGDLIARIIKKIQYQV